jgi:hypothetical protein
MEVNDNKVPLLPSEDVEPPKLTVGQRVKRFFHVPLHKLPPFLISLFFLVGVTYAMAITQVAIEDYAVKHDLNQSARVFDTLFNILPVARDAHLADYFTLGFMGVVLVIVLLNRRLGIMVDIMRRIMFIMAVVYIIRTISISITLLPNPFKLCKSQPVGNYFVEAFYILVGAAQTCHDCFFSGHSVALCLVTMTYFDYLNAPLLVRLLIVPATLAGALIIIATHFHYSVDVLFGYMISFFIWKFFHHIVHHIERFLVRRRMVEEERITYMELSKEFILNEIGQVETKEYLRLVEPLERRRSTDIIHVFLTSILLRAVVWFESLDFLLGNELPSKPTFY